MGGMRLGTMTNENTHGGTMSEKEHQTEKADKQQGDKSLDVRLPARAKPEEREQSRREKRETDRTRNRRNVPRYDAHGKPHVHVVSVGTVGGKDAKWGKCTGKQ